MRLWSGPSALTIVGDLPAASRTPERVSRGQRASRKVALEIDTSTETGQGHDLHTPATAGTRLTLLADLKVALEPESPPSVFAIFDLVGLSEYADLYGRLAGRDLLARVGDELVDAIRQPAAFYSPRETELAAIIRVLAAGSDQLLASPPSALTERLARFNVQIAHGVVMLPADASDPREVLRVADERLFLSAPARKRRERRSARFHSARDGFRL